jgi:hypothetical protein
MRAVAVPAKDVLALAGPVGFTTGSGGMNEDLKPEILELKAG